MQSTGVKTFQVVIADDEPLVRERLRRLIAEDTRLELVVECEDGEEAVRAILNHRPDVLFLDVQMPKFNGFEILEAVRDDHLPVTIFSTAFDHYATRAFEVHAVDYLLKPFSPSRFTQAVDRALQRLVAGTAQAPMRGLMSEYTANKPLTKMVARAGSKIYFVPLVDVEWIEGADNYLRLHTAGRSHLVRGTMKSLEGRLDPERFVRVHRSVIVSIEGIATMEPVAPGVYELTMRSGKKLTSGRAYGAQVRGLFEE